MSFPCMEMYREENQNQHNRTFGQPFETAVPETVDQPLETVPRRESWWLLGAARSPSLNAPRHLNDSDSITFGLRTHKSSTFSIP